MENTADNTDLFVSIAIEKDGKINIRSNINDQLKVLGLLEIASASVSKSMIEGIAPKRIEEERLPDPEKNDAAEKLEIDNNLDRK